MEKRCSGCERILPLSEFSIHRATGELTKLCNNCLEKGRKNSKKYYIANRDKIRKRVCANREKRIKSQERYRKANKDKIAEKGKRYYDANREKFLKGYQLFKTKLIQQGRIEMLNEVIDTLDNTLPPEVLEQLKSLKEVT